MKLIKTTEPIEVYITREGAKAAHPAIWYADLVQAVFKVIKEPNYQVFEVVEGKYKGMLIDPENCEPVKPTL